MSLEPEIDTPTAPPAAPGPGWNGFSASSRRARAAWLAAARQIPDLLTLSRLLLALALLAAALLDVLPNPARDLWFLVAGWTTDMVDGYIARSVRKKRRLTLVGFRLKRLPFHLAPGALRVPPAVAARYETIRRFAIYRFEANQQRKIASWLGRHDVYVDMFVSLAALGYLGITGLLPPWAILAYLAAWGALFLRFGVPDLFAQVFQNPIYAAFLYFAARSNPSVLPWLLLWAALALLLFWRRLAQLFRAGWKTINEYKTNKRI